VVVADSPESEVSSFAIRFPSELEAEQVAAWLHSLSGLLPGTIGRFFGAPTVVLELSASAEHGFQYQLKVSRARADYVVGQLRVHLAGVRVTPEKTAEPGTEASNGAAPEKPYEYLFDVARKETDRTDLKLGASAPPQPWTKVVELGLRKLDRSLRVEPIPLVGGLLASMQGFALHQGEAVLVQWIIRPAVPERPPVVQTARPVRAGSFFMPAPHVPVKDAIVDQRTKLSAVNFLACLRIGVKAGSETRAGQLLGQVQSALKSTNTAANGLYARIALQSTLRRALDTAKAPLLFHMQLTAQELAGLLAWPIGSPHVAGLPQARSRHLPPSGAILHKGLVVARSNFPGAERPLALAPADTCKHIHIVGPIGVGKTAVMGNLVTQAMRAGNGVIVMERKGDLFQAALAAVPRERLADVIVVDVGDERPVGYNLLGEGNPRGAVEGLCQLFEYLYPDMRRGIWARAALHRGLSTLITRPGNTFVDLVPLLSPNARSETESQWRDELIAEVDDSELKRFWQRFDDLSPAQQENYAAPILDRAWQLSERREIRDIIGQSESSFTMWEAIRERKVLLVNLSGVGIETARLVGTLLLNAMWSAVRSGACDPAHPTMLCLDEFQDFVHLPVDPESMLVQARSFGLAMVLAHQHLDQLPDSLRSAVLANARSKIVFQATYDDARVFAREFGRSVTDEDFMNLGAFEVLCRLATADGVSAPASAVTLPPTAPTALGREAREQSRVRYGRDAAAIQADIARRRTPRNPAAPKKRPKLGGVKWE
jgi:hypothetical protein